MGIRRVMGHQAGLVTALVVPVVATVAVMAQAVRPDPERFLADRFQFSADELAQARSGQPVAKMIAGADRNELALEGAIRLDGDKRRLADWITNIAQFRRDAELG